MRTADLLTLLLVFPAAAGSVLAGCGSNPAGSSGTGQSGGGGGTTSMSTGGSGGTSGSGGSAGGGAGGGAPWLVQEGDLVYEGAFLVPQGSFGSDPNAIFDYSDDGLAYFSEHDSLFIKSHTYGQMVAEISIPAPVASTDKGALATAEVLQGFADITEGHLGDEMIQNSMIQGGLLVYGQKLIGSIWAYYDGASEQTKSHFTSDLTLAKTGDFQGLFTVGDPFPAFVGGYMTVIPAAFQKAFGGPALTGHCCTSIISHQSWGPSAWVFDPADLGQKDPAPATGVVYYDQDHPTLGTWDNNATPNPIYNNSSLVTGIVFAAGTRSVLFFGSTGLGVPCYGEGTDDMSLVGQPTGDGSEWCYDPDVASKGTHAYPYASYVWAYDANDMIAAKAGQKSPWDVKPYSTWVLKLPFDTGTNSLNGAAYDEATQRIYISQARADDARPIVHVLKLQQGG